MNTSTVDIFVEDHKIEALTAIQKQQKNYTHISGVP